MLELTNEKRKRSTVGQLEILNCRKSFQTSKRMKGQSDNQPRVRYITTNTFLCETVININNFITLKNFKILKLLTRGEIYANIIGTANICLK
jgi:hypothetical protein